jgi:hypothetical protein
VIPIVEPDGDDLADAGNGHTESRARRHGRKACRVKPRELPEAFRTEPIRREILELPTEIAHDTLRVEQPRTLVTARTMS